MHSYIAKRMKHTANTGLDTPKQVDSGMTMDDTTSSLEMSDDDEEERGVQVVKGKSVPFQSPPLPSIAPSAPSQEYYKDEEVLEPLPPPYAPGSEPNVLAHASAPPDRSSAPFRCKLILQTRLTNLFFKSSQGRLALPSSLQRRPQAGADLPGVSLPPRAASASSFRSSSNTDACPDATKHSTYTQG